MQDMVFIVKSTKHGMQGRLLMFQEQPCEVQTNYAGASALRCNFDVQDLRRVLPEKLWNLDKENYPSLRADENRSKKMGYMGSYEWDGDELVEREEALGVVENPHSGPKRRRANSGARHSLLRSEEMRPTAKKMFLRASIATSLTMGCLPNKKTMRRNTAATVWSANACVHPLLPLPTQLTQVST